MDAMRSQLILQISRKKWWHVPPADPTAYQKRGKFLSSSFREAEFYGRPLDEPEMVSVMSPCVGDEQAIEKMLFGKRLSRDDMSIRERLDLDAKMKSAALKMGFDSIVLTGPKGFEEYQKSGKIPRSIELNLLTVKKRVA